MVNILSQKELDALLDIIPYDDEKCEDVFEVKPSKNKKSNLELSIDDKISLIRDFCDYMLKVNISHLSFLLDCDLEATIESIEEIYCEDIEQNGKDIFKTFSLNSLKYDGILCIDNTLAFAFISKMLGGKINEFGLNRDFTLIELALMDFVFSILKEDLQQSCKDKFGMDLMVRYKKDTPSLLKATIDTKYILIKLRFGVEKCNETIRLYYPYEFIEEIFKKSKKPLGGLHVKKDKSKGLGDKIAMDVVVAKGLLSVRQLLGLRVGDILRLDTDEDLDLYLHVNNEDMFKAKKIDDLESNKLKINFCFDRFEGSCHE